MLFEDSDKRFEFTITGYQFPQTEDEEHDANWLDVTINVRLPEGSYTASSPCFLTWEAGWIAKWLDNIARNVPQSTEIGGLEPELEFEHVVTEEKIVRLRVHASHGMSPPWADRMERGRGVTIDFAVPRTQVAEAAASLHAQLAKCPPRAGAEARPPFTQRELCSWFFIDWLLVVPGTMEDESVAHAIEYMRWINLEPVVQSAQPVPERPERWFVRLSTNLWVRDNEPFRALFQLLSHLPMPYGAPRVHRPYLRPDGAFTCTGELAPTRDDAEDLFSRIRGWFELTNYNDERRFWWVLGQRDSK